MSDFGYSMKMKRRVLIVEDEEINRRILENLLCDEYEVFCAENGAVALDMLRNSRVKFSLILLDLLMPVMNGEKLLEILKSDEVLCNVPVIVMTSEKPAEVRSIRMGADDFIAKPYDSPEVIKARCERIIQLYEDKSIIRSAEKDDLTGLYTREFLLEYVRQQDEMYPDTMHDAVVLNIDHFHMLNEMFGRSVGDEVLRKLADSMWIIFGDEFLGSRPDADYFFLYVEHRDSYEEICERLNREMAGYLQLPRTRFRVGIYQNADKEASIEERFDHAKYACDRIRGDYSRQISYYSRELNDVDLYHERLINDIEKAIEDRDLVVFYQPKYGIQSEKPVLKSAEALIRWKHHELGMISPGDFIPLFEKNGLIQKVDRFVWEEAAAQIRRWKDEYGVSIPVSVNVSRVDIYDPDLSIRLTGLLEKYDLEPADLMLEITESAYSDDAKGLIGVVEKLRDLGFKIEMDDFGSGYSSLNMLTSMPIDVLKMDMEFIRNMDKDEKCFKLVELVIDIADFLNVPVIAEGVETGEQLETLKGMGCDIIQGYYFSKPVEPEEFSRFIEEMVRG